MVDEQSGGRRDGDPLDKYFADNMSRLREAAGISQAEMVQRLREAGWSNVHPTTISRIEKRERPVRLSEAARIAGVLNQDLQMMVLPPSQAGAEEEAARAVRVVVDMYNQVGEAVFWLLTTQGALRKALRELRPVVEREGDKRLREKLLSAERFLKLSAEKAVKTGRAAYEDGRIMNNFDYRQMYALSTSSELTEDQE